MSVEGGQGLALLCEDRVKTTRCQQEEQVPSEHEQAFLAAWGRGGGEALGAAG